MSERDLAEFEFEAFFVRRLGDFGREVFAGLTDRPLRRERIRTAIIEARLDGAILGRNPRTQKPETFAAAFERHWGEPLHTNEAAAAAGGSHDEANAYPSA